MKHTHTWSSACSFDDLLPDSGVAALIDGRQIAIFRVGDAIYALDNYDPHSEANVLSRGLVGDLNGEPVVALPCLQTSLQSRDRPLRRGRRLLGACVADARERRQDLDQDPAAAQDQSSQAGRHRQRHGGHEGGRGTARHLRLSPTTSRCSAPSPCPTTTASCSRPCWPARNSFDDIVLNPVEWYRDNGVTLHLGDPAVAIDRIRRRVRSQSGIEADYDRLLLATGSNPIMLPVPGKDLPGVVTFRDLQDVNTMLEAARTHQKAVVIGGGLLGLEAANALLKQGMQVTVVHLLETLMERQLDPVAAQLLKQSLEKRGLHFHMPARTTAILGTDRVRGVQFADETIIEADLVVMAAGIRPNTDLARAAGLRCDRGVLVNDTMQTFDPCVYAVGECVQHRNNTYGLVAPLYEQASVCATHLSEHGVGRYRGSMLSTHLKVTGIDLFSAGDFLGGPTSEALVLRDAKRGIYKRIVLEDNKVRGAVLYGDTRDGARYCEADE